MRTVTLLTLTLALASVAIPSCAMSSRCEGTFAELAADCPATFDAGSTCYYDSSTHQLVGAEVFRCTIRQDRDSWKSDSRWALVGYASGAAF